MKNKPLFTKKAENTYKFDEYTINGSDVTPNICRKGEFQNKTFYANGQLTAGTESKANIISLNSIDSKHSSNGVASF